MRTCPFTDCSVQLAEHIFACRAHWFSLNNKDRHRINLSYAQYMNDTIDLQELRERQQAVLGDRGNSRKDD